MNKPNIFDSAMDYIDKNIRLNIEEIYRGIYVHSGYSDADFNKFIAIATDGKLCLRTYIRDRRLYFAAKDLVEHPEKPIVQIAHDYGYSEQSSFSRAMKQVYDYTPNVIRKKRITIRDNRMHFSDFHGANSRLDEVLDQLKREGDLSISDWDYFEQFINATNEYGFDTATCCAISEVADRIGVPFWVLLNSCFDTMVEVRSQSGYIPPDIETIIDCGITSQEELEEICTYYNCKYHHLSPMMVDMYRQQNEK